MQQNRPAQLIELEESERAETTVMAEVEQDAANGTANSEQEIQPVASGWVRDHEHRSEEYRRAFKNLLTEEGFISTVMASRDGK